METDVVVVGAGGAGMLAAREAARRGARVVVVDALGEAGGTARTAGGGSCIAGSPLQRSLGLEDSPDLALRDWLAWGGPAVDEVWAQRYLEASVGELYEVFAELGIEWVGVRANEGNRVPRWHAPRGGGRAVTMAMEASTRAAGQVRWRFETRVRELVRAGGRVVGVVVEDAHGSEEIRADSVLLATGGFNGDIGRVQRHAVEQLRGARVLCGGGRGARGEGHDLLETVDAAFVQLDAVWMYPYGTPDPDDPAGERGLAVRGLDGDLWVNADGERFHDETRRGGATGTPALLAQPDASCWSIIDATVASGVTLADPRYRTGVTPDREAIERFLETSAFVTRGHDLRAVADGAGIDPDGLERTVSMVNGWLDAGLEHDPRFGRPLDGVGGVRVPPFTAIRFFPIARKNLGGVRTDLDGQVMDTAGRAVPGLFAAGELAGMAGGHINGRAALEGTMFAPSCFSGLIAGRSMVA